MGFFGDLWAKQHGKQLMLSATGFGASAILLIVSGYQLLFLQSDAEWGEFTGAAIGMLVFSSLLLIVITPEFLNLRSYVNLLDELKQIDSTSELKRRKSEGDEAAKILGAGHAAAWEDFLVEKGLKKRK
ncbi:MAG TPA: hypothetical protein HA359_07075 [Candidatus Poseidoniaceae archaeon]|jgi:hypothetical protein|nr:MAG TPA: hypothetical protein D7H84_07045 [Candidatus Poseidoniales archaeon]DAC59322.1 MAG TPA: hypothetical protein D7I03_04270 [Candidatus Poseidoniales archaeon]HII24002.1 hypothetical protein [Candidatus Poseidoniaceae archaeon]HII50536.1 hypothetical protein [Candidatus Poseidoniaceae archaeon]|tara:strand:- start:438 stop:824 length:387 start_codon:yes stop_codon:yes gene_type:complete